jgi:hypothetical protein
MRIDYHDGFLDGLLVGATSAGVLCLIGCGLFGWWILRGVAATLPSPERREWERSKHVPAVVISRRKSCFSSCEPKPRSEH